MSIDTHESNKSKVNLTIDKNLVKRAHELGINVSKVCENGLKAFIENIERSEMVRLPGFEPGSSTWQQNKPNSVKEDQIRVNFSQINWNAYFDFISKTRKSPQSAKELFQDTQRHAGYLLNNNFAGLRDLSEGARSNALRALAKLSKFLGCYDEFQRQRKAFGYTWGPSNQDDIIINRLNKTQDSSEIFTWMLDVKHARPDLALFVDFLAVSGLRCGEAVNSYNLIIELSKTGLLYQKYLNPKTQMLEHFRFKQTFIRTSKKAFISYVPEHLIEDISDNVPLTTVGGLIKRVDNEGLKTRFSDVREFYASYMTQWLSRDEIDMMQGRVGASIWMANYYNYSLVPDLVKRLDIGTHEVLTKIDLARR